jgi:ketosteroid isomerase-like protein
MTESNVELARRGFDAVRRGDLEAIRDLLHPDVKWHGGDPTAEGACQNRAQALQYMRARGGRGIGELVEVLDAGEQVVVIMRPRSQDGEPPSSLVANLTTFRDGQVVEMVHYDNAADAVAAAGL